MRKGKFVFWMLLLLLGVGVYMGSKVRWQKKIIPIVATNQDILDYIENPTNIVKWFAPFADTIKNKLTQKSIQNTDRMLQIPTSNLIKTEWEYTAGNTSKEKYFFKILPTDAGFTNLEFYYKASWFQQVFGNNKKRLTQIEYLKKYLETPKLFYGMDIEEGSVTDTFLLVYTRNIQSSILQNEIAKSFQLLIQYATQKNAGYTGTRILHENKKEDGTIDLYTAIGINTIVDTQNENGFSFSRMPKGKLLIANYEGAFAKREPVLKKFTDYYRKLRYQSMAIPFEKILDTGIRFTDTQKVHIKICLPVY